MTSKGIVKLSLGLGSIILIFLFWWIYFRETAVSHQTWTIYLPKVNAALNTITACLLVWGYRAIKSGDVEKHKKIMLSATTTSFLFLVSYLVYHYFQGDTKFIEQGAIRYIYFFILISHILLSMVQVPLILMTLSFAFLKKFEAHKKIAPWTYWIWLYVSVTGVLVFFFLKYLNT